MRVLFLENHGQFARTVVSTFLQAHDVQLVGTVSDAVELLRRHAFDAFLVDYDLDEEKGDAFVHEVVASRTTAPVIAVSSRDEGNWNLLEAGATAVCPKLEFSSIEQVLIDAVDVGSRLEVHLAPPKHGWLDLTFVLGIQHLVLGTSYTPADTVRQLVETTRDLALGQDHTRVVFYLEPTLVELRLDADGDDLSLNLAEANLRGEFRRTRLAGRCFRTSFAQAVRDGLERLARHITAEEYADAWRHPFPRKELGELSTALRPTAS